MRSKLALGLIALALASSGCRKVYPGDGRLVILDVENDALVPVRPQNGVMFDPVPRSELVRYGAHMWDVVGVKFRMPDEVTTSEAEIAVHLPIKFEKAPWHLNDIPNEAGVYMGATGEIYIEMNEVTDGLELDEFRGWKWGPIVGHELGHALGLIHTDVKDAIMYLNGVPIDRHELSQTDQEMFVKIWGATSVTINPQ